MSPWWVLPWLLAAFVGLIIVAGLVGRSRSRPALLGVAVATLGFLIGLGLAVWNRSPVPASAQWPSASPVIGAERPEFEHASLDGRLVRADDFDGQLLLVNFWATWCAPCLREMPVLQAAHEAHDGRLAVVGIALDEPGVVRDFVERLWISYPILIGTSDVMNTSSRWGNAAGLLPYTVLVGPDRTFIWQHHGELSADELDRRLREHLP